MNERCHTWSNTLIDASSVKSSWTTVNLPECWLARICSSTACWGFLHVAITLSPFVRYRSSHCVVITKHNQHLHYAWIQCNFEKLLNAFIRTHETNLCWGLSRSCLTNSNPKPPEAPWTTATSWAPKQLLGVATNCFLFLYDLMFLQTAVLPKNLRKIVRDIRDHLPTALR